MMEVASLTAEQLAIIAGKIRQLGFNQTMLSTWIGIAQGSFSEKLRGHRAFTTDEIGELADYLGIEDLRKLYPVKSTPEMRRRKRMSQTITIIKQALDRLTPYDIQEVLLGFALILEAKNATGNTRETRILRGLSGLELREPRPDMHISHDSLSEVFA